MHVPDFDIATTAGPLDVAIIGGGAAGVLAAVHLLRASGGRARLCVIEPRRLLGEGVAFSTREPGHLLNVRAGGMSVFDDDPDHFVRHMASRETIGTEGDSGAMAQRFVPRVEFGRYLRDTLAEQLPTDPVHLRDEAVDVTGSGPYSILLGSGRTVHAKAVIVAIGNFPRALPLDGPGTCVPVDHAWDYVAIDAIPADSDICIIGSGLSMVDAVVTLHANGHRGVVHVLSRHGRMPLVHASTRGPAGEVDDLLSLGVLARMRVLRSRAEDDVREGKPWQWTMDRLRPHGQRLWRSLDDNEQRRFLRHAQSFWDIHRHRIAPEAAACIDAMRGTGQLTVHAGRVQSIIGGRTRNEVVFRARHSAQEDRLQVDRVIVCAGIETHLERMPGRLIAALSARGVIAPGPHGRGLAVDDAGSLVDADGRVHPRLLALGALRLGQSWETTAIPELRSQAEALSRKLIDAVDLDSPN